MKLRKFTSCAALAVALVLSNAPAQDKAANQKSTDTKPAAGAPDSDEATKRWMEASTPAAAHKVLDPLVGDWDVASKWWMDPSAPPMETKGTTTKKWILDGRFVQEDFKGEMFGMPMIGHGMTGYDNVKKQYNSFWVDSSSTAMYISFGKASADGNTLTFHGKMDDVTTGEKDKPIKFILKIEGTGRHAFEMFDLGGGKEKKLAEMTYTRK